MNKEETNKLVGNYRNGVLKGAESLQEEFNALVDAAKTSNPKLEYQDILTTFIFLQLADIKDKLEED